MLFNRKPYLIYSTASGRESRVTISGNSFIVGSGEDCDLRVNAPKVAKRHLIFSRMEDHWIVRVEGINPIRIGDQWLNERDRTIHSNETLTLADVVNIRFVDPVEDAVRKEALKAAAIASDGGVEKPSTSPRIIVLFVVVMALSLAFYFFVQPSPNQSQPTDFSTLSLNSIESAVQDLPVCVEAAEKRVRNGLARADLDLKSKFWHLVAAGDKSGTSTEDLKADVRRWLLEAMRADGRGDSKSARRAYTAVLELVPDAQCDANKLAAIQQGMLQN